MASPNAVLPHPNHKEPFLPHILDQPQLTDMELLAWSTPANLFHHAPCRLPFNSGQAALAGFTACRAWRAGRPELAHWKVSIIANNTLSISEAPNG